MEYTTGTAVFHDWMITREISQGVTGKVYEIKKNGVEQDIRSALKVVTIPPSNLMIESLVSEGMTRTDVANYFKEFVDKILYEVKIMIALRNHPNIVAYEGHCVLPHEDGIGWDILIKMELLTSLEEWLSNHLAYGRTMVRMGKEISSAIMYMLDNNLIHRNIKPDNIFVDSSETFKLGGFGVTTTIENAINNPGKVGTESYMAPEVYFGKKYNVQIDIYSLGIVLYRSQNSNRLPFYPSIAEKLTHSDKETALMKRMQGKKFPEPVNGSEEFKAIILKACEYLPKNRYASMRELHDDLQKLEEEMKGKIKVAGIQWVFLYKAEMKSVIAEVKETIDKLMETSKDLAMIICDLFDKATGIVPPENMILIAEMGHGIGNALTTIESEANWLKCSIQMLEKNCNKLDSYKPNELWNSYKEVAELTTMMDHIRQEKAMNIDGRKIKEIKNEAINWVKDISRIADYWCAQKWQNGKSNINNIHITSFIEEKTEELTILVLSVIDKMEKINAIKDKWTELCIEMNKI